ncbi:hypothetical protein LTR95_006372 [Oleoguttula sp. CCFEE 5521]
MAIAAISHAPKAEDFTALSAHQEQTPTTFFASKPVLHFHTSQPASLRIRLEDLNAQADFKSLAGDNATQDGDNTTIPNIDVWVTSSSLLLYSPSTTQGLSLPYPHITVHALSGSSVLLELSLSDPHAASSENDDFQHLTLHITPVSSTAPDQSAEALYRAIGDCQELNPDPQEEDEGGMTGEGGWITSENMGNFVGEGGEFRVPEGVTAYGDEEDEEGGMEALGPGAGRTRGLDEVDGGGDEEDEGGEGRKWVRTANEDGANGVEHATNGTGSTK